MSNPDSLSVPSTEPSTKSASSSTTDISSSYKSPHTQQASRDEESGVIEKTGAETSVEEKQDPNLVTWDGPEDPDNPKNWSLRRKWVTTVIVSGFAFISPLSSSMAAPALDSIGRDLKISEDVQRHMVLSIFLLSFSFGPFILSPCSEIWGRRRIIRFGNIVFILFNTACGFARTEAQIIAFRLLAGFGGSATLGMGSAVLSDCWQPSERGKGSSIYQLAPVLGPALGPIVGGVIAANTTWRWTFWSISLLNVFIQVFATFLFPETYAPRLLVLKARKLRAQTGNQELRTAWERSDRTLAKVLGISLTRPWRLLATQPIVQLLALYQAFNFGMLYLLISSFPDLWEGRYGMPKATASLNYLSLAVGSLLGSQACGPLNDWAYRRLKRRHGIAAGEPGVPEFRIPLMIPAALVLPCGIFLYAWSAEARVFWLVPNIGVAIFSGSSMVSYLCIQTYIADSYTVYAASASAASAFLRSLAAFSFPLFVPYLFRALGYGVGGSVLGVVGILLGIPAPLVFWKYGARLRARSAFATA